MQKLLFGLLMASRKLHHYFQAHEITVVTRLPLQRILHNPDATGRIVEWALELSSFGLRFESTSTIKSRALAEFIAEWTATPDEEIQETTLPGKEMSSEWIMYFDGAFPLQGAGSSVILDAPTGEHLKYVIQMHFPGKNQRTIRWSKSGCLPISGSRQTSESRSSSSEVICSSSSSKLTKITRAC